MFNKTYVNNVESPSNITAHHHRAPTDESIRLANEYQEKALNNIIDRIKVDTNLVKGEIILYNDRFSFNQQAILKFNINGKDFILKEEFDTSYALRNGKILAVRKLIKAFSETIVEQLIVESEDTRNFMSIKSLNM